VWPDRLRDRTQQLIARLTLAAIALSAARAARQPVDRDAEPAGVSAAKVRRRLSIVSVFFAFLQARGDVPANPVPRRLPPRRERSRPGQGVPLVPVTRRLPRILSPADVDALTAALLMAVEAPAVEGVSGRGRPPRADRLLTPDVFSRRCRVGAGSFV
jgi:site-specific recombinase XerC